jgi:methylphosphotriester-DNA--protein-cysteine methyltransferase
MDSMMTHHTLTDGEVLARIRSGEIRLAGNRRLRIYGRLECASGKRMNRANRVFFESEAEAIRLGYRPCGHCMRVEYQRWKGGHEHG